MAGTFVVDRENILDREGLPKGQRIVVTATADGSAAFGSCTILRMNGGLAAIGIVPGSPAPTTAMDAYLYHPQSSALDVLGGALVDIDTSSTTFVKPKVNGNESGVGLNGTHTLTLSNNLVANASIKFIFDLYDI